MWSMDYVQVPAEEEKPEEVAIAKEKNTKLSSKSAENQNESTKKRVHELVKQMSISAEGSSK